jgi:predicted MFS family arabinose efflux permease
MGWALGSGLGGLLAEINFELLFWVDGITNLSAALLMWLILKPTKYKPQKEKDEALPPQRSAYSDRTYILFIVITMIFASCFFQIFTNLPVFFQNDLGFSKSYIGILMAVNGIIIALLEMVLVFKMEQGKNHNRFIVRGVGLVGLAFLMLNIPGMDATLAIPMIVLITFGEIFAMPFLNTFWISRSQDSNRGQYAGLYTMAWSAAQCLGPLLGAQVAEGFGFKTLWWSIGLLALFASAAYYWLDRREKLQTTP